MYKEIVELMSEERFEAVKKAMRLLEEGCGSTEGFVSLVMPLHYYADSDDDAEMQDDAYYRFGRWDETEKGWSGEIYDCDSLGRVFDSQLTYSLFDRGYDLVAMPYFGEVGYSSHLACCLLLAEIEGADIDTPDLSVLENKGFTVQKFSYCGADYTFVFSLVEIGGCNGTAKTLRLLADLIDWAEM